MGKSTLPKGKNRENYITRGKNTSRKLDYQGEKDFDKTILPELVS